MVVYKQVIKIVIPPRAENEWYEDTLYFVGISLDSNNNLKMDTTRDIFKAFYFGEGSSDKVKNGLLEFVKSASPKGSSIGVHHVKVEY